MKINKDTSMKWTLFSAPNSIFVSFITPEMRSQDTSLIRTLSVPRVSRLERG